MSESKPCARCGDDTPTVDNLVWKTFWGAVKHQEVQTTERTMTVLATDLRQGENSRVTRVDETSPLCEPCWSLLVRFLQGVLPIPPVEHEHVWVDGGRLGTTPGHREGGYPIDRCTACEQTRLAPERDR